MIRAAHIAALAAFVMSVALHLVGVTALWPENAVEMEGGAPVSAAQLGNSFKDVSEGTTTPLPVEDVIKPKTTDAAADVARPKEVREQAEPKDALEDIRPDMKVSETPPQEADAVRIEGRAEQPRPKQQQEETQEEASPQETSTDDDQEKPQPEPPKEAVAGSQGANEPDQVLGSNEGEESAAETEVSKRQSANLRQAGNAEASDYPGKVMRKILRQRRPRSYSRGVVTIAFDVSASGAISDIRVIDSSGHAQLDRAGMQMIRSAAPFPKPPVGAQTSFFIEVQGR